MSERGWTINTLRKHLIAMLSEMDKRNEQRFLAQESAVTAALAAAKEAVAKAESASEKRFENTNEWRQVITDRDQTFVPRREMDGRLESHAQKLDAQDEKLNSIENRLAQSQGRGSGLNSGWAYLIGFVGLSAAIVTLVISLTRHA